MILQSFKDKGWVVDWDGFVRRMLRIGWNSRTLLEKTSSAVGEVYGRAYLDRWRPLMETLIEKSEKK